MKKTFKFIVVAAFALAITAAVNVSAAYVHAGTLKMGMSSSQVMSLQQTLNANGYVVATTGAGSPGMESMYFGAKTKAAVMSFQAAKGLGADGVVGSKTGAALAALGGGSTGGGVPGCPAGAMYNYMTGAPCTGSTGSGVLSGTAGDITVSSYTSGLETNVGEGDSNKKVLGFEIEADAGSDVAINSVKLTFENQGSGSDRITRYASNVSVWDQNGNKVGSSNTSDFSESSGVYSRSIALSNVVIRADQKARFFVAVSALENIDSSDYSSDSWVATLDSARFTDASGAILTEDTNITRTFNFASLATANDLELKVNLSSSNLKAQTVKVSTTNSTNNVELLKFTMKAQGGKMTVDQVPVLFTTDDDDIDGVTGNVTLNIGGSTFSETVSTTSSSAATTITFDNLNLDIAAGDTVTGTVTADINSTSAYSEGTTLYASIPSSYVTATSGTLSVDVEDVNGDQLVTGDRTGSATGETMTLRSTGVNVVMGTATTDRTTDTSGNVTSVSYTIPVSVTSFGNTLYVGQSAQLATSASGSYAFALAFQQSGAATTDEVTSSASIALSSSDATIETNGFRIDDGSTKHFTITVTLSTPTTTGANYRVQLKQIKTFTNAALYTGATSSSLLPAEQFRTGYQFITS